MAGRVETEAGKVLPANWERKDRPWFQDKSSVVERPASHLKHSISEKSTFQEAPRVAQPGGVKTLGLDINAFVPVCYQRTSTSFQNFLHFWCICFTFIVIFAVCKIDKGRLMLAKSRKEVILLQTKQFQPRSMTLKLLRSYCTSTTPWPV